MAQSGKTGWLAGILFIALLASGAYFLWGMPASVDERSESQTLFAIGSYHEFLEETTRSKDADSLYRQGMAAIKVGDFALAEEKLFQNLVIEQNNVTQAILKSLTLFNKNDPEGAQAILSNLKLKNPLERSVVQLLRGVYYIETGEFKKAENTLVTAQKSDPTAPATPYFLAVAQNGAKKWGASLSNMEKAANLGYTGPAFNRVMAEGHYGATHWSEAREYYEKLVSAGVKDIDTLTRLAEATYRVGDLEETITIYKRIVEQYGEETVPKFRLAKLYIEDENFEAATIVYDDLEKDVGETQLIELWIEKLGLYHEQGRIQEKEELYNTIAANIKNNNELMLQLAQKLFDIDMSVQAGSYIEAVMVRAPNNKKAKQLYKQYLILDLLLALRTDRGVDFAVEKLLANYPGDAVAKNYAVLAFLNIEDEAALTRLTQELGWDGDGQKSLLMQIFYQLHEKNIDQAYALVGQLDPAQVDIVKISLLQWYIAAARGNKETQTNLVQTLSLRVPGLNEELVGDVFVKEFGDWLNKFTDFYDDALIERLGRDE